MHTLQRNSLSNLRDVPIHIVNGRNSDKHPKTHNATRCHLVDTRTDARAAAESCGDLVWTCSMYPSCLQSIFVNVPANVTIKFAFSHRRQTHVVFQPCALISVCISELISSLRSHTNTCLRFNLPSRRRGTSDPYAWTVVTSTALCPSHNKSCKNMFPLIRCTRVQQETSASNLKIAGLEDPACRGTIASGTKRRTRTLLER